MICEPSGKQGHFLDSVLHDLYLSAFKCSLKSLEISDETFRK